MSFWLNVLAQFLGDLLAGAIIMTIAVYVENRLDILRDRKRRR